MNLPDVHINEALRQREFPVCADKVYLAHAGVSPTDIDYVNAHGTGTAFNDAMESRAIRSALGDAVNPIVVSTKGYVGHTLGAAGAIEAVFALESLMGGWVPASAGADPVDSDIDLLVPTKICDVELTSVLTGRRHTNVEVSGAMLQGECPGANHYVSAMDLGAVSLRQQR